MAFRQLKKQITALLQRRDLAAALATIDHLPARQVVNPLFGLLYHGDQRTRWHAVAAMGRVVARLADDDREWARVVVRRLMWNLNDESGGIGWGSPEAMGEILACHAGLAREYAPILVSYLDPCGNFLEHEQLQAGVLWALGRLARIEAKRVAPAVSLLPPFISAEDPRLRGLAIWAAAPLLVVLPDKAVTDRIRNQTSDHAVISIFQDGELISASVGALASAAMAS